MSTDPITPDSDAHPSSEPCPDGPVRPDRSSPVEGGGRGLVTWGDVLDGNLGGSGEQGTGRRGGARSRGPRDSRGGRERRLEALPAWSASYLARRHAGTGTGTDAELETPAGGGGRHRGPGRGPRTARRRREAISDHRLVTAPTGPTTSGGGPSGGGPPWWWLLRPGAARDPRRPARAGDTVRRRPRRATLLLTSMLAVAALLGPLVAAGPIGSVAAGALPPPDDGPLGATGTLPDFFTPPGDLPTNPAPGDPAAAVGGAAGGNSGAVAGIPAGMLAAYRRAEANLSGSSPSCRLGWALVAGIGKVESGHARGGAIDADGTTLSPILGPRLDGSGANAAIPDTDGGIWDGDTVWDRAVGPTQFIPSTWQAYGVDATGDGRADPNNAHDAATATGRYLCAGGLNLSDPAQLHDAVFRYNHSESYVATVLSWARTYAAGTTTTPDAGDTPSAGSGIGRATGRDPVTLAAASAPAAVASAPAVDGAGSAPGTVPAAAAAPPAPPENTTAPSSAPSSPGRPSPSSPLPPVLAPTSVPRPTVPGPNPVPSTSRPTNPRPTSSAPATPGPTSPPTPSTPATSSSTTRPAPSAPVGRAEQACRGLSPVQVAEAFGLPPGTVTRSTDAGGCQFRGAGGLLLTIDVTQSNQNTRMSDRPVVKSGHGRQLVISFGGRDQLRLTVPEDAPLTTRSAEAGLGTVAARLW